ncbi:Cas9 inhibitor AcrIIA9 family protein [Flavobacterium sp. F52]|uniref:Cas9 inhibitor AcrIIA9 family protein n=1 Tax=Flavobacterium sp. F52 TaxID=1202532 RepID=UPI000272D854|nr:Cas9 inhibitor AcrIIA9 family protein [Flavobacterium sp. F52]EJG03155.1 hypothetical protein FF52_03145 [Flavobacterium sp. F52]
MKATDNFKAVIEKYLKETAQGDTVFAEHFAKASKNLESCYNYIFAEVRKTGCCAFENQEIFDMAAKYYTDDSIWQTPPVQCRVEVSKPLQDDLFSTAEHIPAVKTAVKTPVAESKTLTLFDL